MSSQLPDGMGADEAEMLPSSSRVKKVLEWSRNLHVFVMKEEDASELRELVITNKDNWNELDVCLKGLPRGHHPSERRQSIFKGTMFWLVASILLALLLYLFFIILQLALFNLIMLVVMIVTWLKTVKIARAVISRMLDNGRKAPFKKYMRKMKELDWLRGLGLEI